MSYGPTTSAACTIPCPNSNSETCGGTNSNDVYFIDYTACASRVFFSNLIHISEIKSN